MPPRSQSLISKTLQSIPAPLRTMLALLTSLLSLRNILLLFCLLNIKNLPLVWELRLIYRSYRAWLTKHDVANILSRASSSTTTATNNSEPNAPAPITAHPLFAPLTIRTTTPLLEIDHNLHKSNSTYFSDLDESRTALMVRLLSSTKFSPAELDREGFKGPFAVILGAVHATFHREIKPYEGFEIRSRIVGWDGKWILIGSVFVRGKRRGDWEKERKERERRGKGAVGKSGEEELAADKGEVLLASCLSKYVVKKGRYTVPPERCWRSAGWLPEKPAGAASPPAMLRSSVVPTPDSEPVNGEVKITEEDLRRRAQETAAKAADKLEQSQNQAGRVRLTKADEACREQASKWSWDDIEAERKRGMELGQKWFGLDKELKELYESDFSRGIVRK